MRRAFLCDKQPKGDGGCDAPSDDRDPGARHEATLPSGVTHLGVHQGTGGHAGKCGGDDGDGVL